MMTSCYERWRRAIAEINQLAIKLEHNYMQNEKIMIKLQQLQSRRKQNKKHPPLDLKVMLQATAKFKE